MAQIIIDIHNRDYNKLKKAIDEVYVDEINGESIDTNDNAVIDAYIKEMLMNNLKGFVRQNIRRAEKRQTVQNIDDDITLS